MPKLSLIANPTFPAPVDIPVAGAESVKVLMTFKHRTKDDLDKFIKTVHSRDDTENFMEMVTGWELDDPFNKESVELLLQNYMGTSLATYKVYIDELVKHKTGN